VSWELKEIETGNIVGKAPSNLYGSKRNGQTIQETITMVRGKSYTFTIYDDANDGLCCDYGYGYYQIIVDGVVVATGDKYQTWESKTFTVFNTPPSTVDVTVNIKFDYYSAETGWSISDNSNNNDIFKIRNVPKGKYNPSANYGLVTIQETVTVIRGRLYRFTIDDEWGDGLCCDHGDGYYKVMHAEQHILLQGNRFEYTESKNFIIA